LPSVPVQSVHYFPSFIFELPNNDASLIPVASCLVVKASHPEALKDAKGNPIIRPYTPVSPPDAPGILTLLVKRYENGNMSKYIHTLKVFNFLFLILTYSYLLSLQEGDTLSIKGPILKFLYQSLSSIHLPAVHAP